ncbi:serine/threonine-protein kinase DCLK1-like [Dendronephthya gigantea]|uniref:serine/threonine-protein kinase DCLK1-like n=1 Tax=Dendronephthya gigantea TaxID=151771 RepID=UPI00106BEE78|nr:serine/threonine-protein kinase DCLK1-like [Dendronephthya gigantea]
MYNMAIRAAKNVVPKVVTFYKNGDKFFRGYKLAITPQKYRNMETLLNDLTRLLNLPLGARYVLTKTGKAVENLQEFESGQGYICSSFPKLKNLRYGVGDNLPYWNSSKHVNKDKATQSTKYYTTSKGSTEQTSPRKRSDTIKPRIITVIRYGHKPRRSAKVLLNKRTAQTFDQVLDEVTLAIGVWGTNGVRRLYDLTGKRLTELSDLFKQDDCFIAVGNEKFNVSDLEDLIQGVKVNGSQKIRLPSINSTDESDVSPSTHHRPSPRNPQSKNSVKLPTIRRKSENDSNTSSLNSTQGLKENIVNKQTVQKCTPKNGKKNCSQNEDQSIGKNNQSLKDTNIKSSSEKKGNISQGETLSSPEDTSHGLAFNRGQKSESRKKIDNIELIYSVGEKIGDGNFAVVRIGTNKETKQKHALKIIDRKKIVGKENMLKDEIRIMKACSHGNIVKLYDTIDTEFDVYLVMELITGGDLFDEISNAVKFEEPIASSFAQDIANALEYLHKQNIVHRDLKPENLLVHISSNGKKHLKLADFGLAVEVRVPLFTVCGTPTYVAPEILEETGYGLKVDVWAAGVIIYIMLCGFPPFRSPNKDQDELFDLIIAGDYEFLPPYWDDVSQDAKDLVSKLLVIDTKQRFTAQEILNHHWIQDHQKESIDEEVSFSDREFNARRKFKGAAIAIASSNRLQNIVQFQFKRGEKLLEQRS